MFEEPSYHARDAAGLAGSRAESRRLSLDKRSGPYPCSSAVGVDLSLTSYNGLRIDVTSPYPLFTASLERMKANVVLQSTDPRKSIRARRLVRKRRSSGQKRYSPWAGRGPADREARPPGARTRVWGRTTVAGNTPNQESVCDDPSNVRQRLLIVDDHADFRASARVLLELEGFDVVGLAEDGEEALLAVEQLEPDVVLLDIQLPGMDGFDVARALGMRDDAPRVVLISSRAGSAYTRQLREAQVSGFLSKDELSGAALRALVA
jgi:CheY-like chemotaxis protein